MTTLQEYRESVNGQMIAGVNYLLKDESVLTPELAIKVGKTIKQHSELATVRTYAQIKSKTADGYLSEADAVSLAHALSTQLVAKEDH